MGNEDLKKEFLEASRLKDIVLEDKNIDILLYLAKYNPNVQRENIIENFGADSIKGLEDLKGAKLVRELSDGISLTEEGIFHVDGLLSIVL
ncbi:hypothetical protein COV61_01245 [Candidatus Micrarchaeota archaeon CG11_big_fil_rev_8_21_14_0_20_47_5]|nr:MAG: hypothetical protein AUJ17_01200 [Candidatus Micrarchaeota archaeon CG1_02_47_40]PIN84087.1 MAG: hypothetical protein COV61_01245 [Candidatus Micrarchaeota archaeon CG11_big_fil_rev_8_21_14_0_20_47_5]